MWVEERLDRAMATQMWISQFHNACVFNLATPSPDHSALFLDFLVGKETKKRRFRFENAWLKEKDCRSLVTASWERNSGSNVQERLGVCSADLQFWGDKLRLQFRDRIKKCRAKLKVLRTKRDETSIGQYDEVSKELGCLLNQQETYWKQRAKQFWLVHGDSNTKFFHQYASSRKKKNAFEKLKDEHGQWQYWDTGLQQLIFRYFNDIFTSRGCNGEIIFSKVKI